MVGQALIDVAIDVEVGVHHHLVQALQVVVLQHLLKTEHAVRLRAAPFGGVDRALFQRRQDVAAAHGDRGHANVVIGLARNARRRAEAVLPEVLHGRDRLLEPAERFRTDRLQHEALDVHAHLAPEALVKLLAAAILKPGKKGDVVDADTGAGHGRAEQHGRRMLAGPVMRPGEPAFDQPLVDRIKGLLNTNHGTRRQNLDLHLAIGQIGNILAKLVQHMNFIGLRRYHRLNTDGHLLRKCRRRHQCCRYPSGHC